METILFISVLLTGLLLFTIIIYAIFIMTPVIIAPFGRNLIYWLVLWLLLVLFNQSEDKTILPILPVISFDRAVWLFMMLAFFVQAAFKKNTILSVTKIEVLMIIFCLTCLISKLITDLIVAREGIGMSNLLNGFFFPFSIFFLAKNLINTEKNLKTFLLFLLLIGIYLTFTGIFEHYPIFSKFVFPRYILDPNVGIHWGRSRGPFTQSAVNGMVLGIIFLMSYFLLILEQKQLNKKIYGFFIFIMPVAIYFTYTRSCWLGLFVSIALIAFYYREYRKVLFSGIFVLIIGGIVKWVSLIDTDMMSSRAKDMEPIYSRINLFFATIRMFIEKPFFGFGFDAFEEFSPDYFNRVGEIPYMGVGLHQHDTFMGILAELGLAGFLPLILIYFFIIKYSIRLYNNLSSDSGLDKCFVALFWGSTIMFLLNSVLIDMRFFLFSNSLYFLLAGIIVGYDQRILLKKAHKVISAGDAVINENTAII